MENVNLKILKSIKPLQSYLFLLLLLPLQANASFIESTIGTAVINDATAAYYNPAALMLLKNPQLIILGSVGDFRTQFIGQSTLLPAGFTESGSAKTQSRYYLPSLYLGIPATDRITFGLSVIANSANRDIGENSILRYAQASNNIQDYDIVPAIEVKINEFFSLGAGVNFSYSNFHLQPITRFPGANIADSNSDNQCNGFGVGANVGFLLKLSPATVIGFNYRSITTYQLDGKSIFNGAQQIISNNYHFKLSTPARSVFSINHFITPKMGFITTIQRIRWSTLRNIQVFGIATQFGILNATIPYHLHDIWAITLGNHYQVTPKWIVRVAGTYNQSPGNPDYQITNGDSIILGTSMGYKINKYLTVDGSYAHAFIKDQSINVVSNRILINGINEGARDAVSLKLTLNFT
jgi:long-subunit fatty acid transport protein